MKRILFILVVTIITFSTAIAQQIQQQGKNKFEVKLNTELKDIPIGKASSAAYRTQYPKKNYAQQRMAKPVSAQKNSLRAAQSPADAATFLVGNFIARGESDFDGNVSWDVTIRKDATDANKYWIASIIDGTNKEAYGTLTGTTLSIPIGQTIFQYTGYADGILWGIDTNGDVIQTGTITATVDEAEGTITFASGLALMANGTGQFYEVILPSPIFYHPDAVIEALYRRPKGTLFFALDAEGTGYSLTNFIALASPFVTWTFENLSDNPTSTTYSWSYTDLLTTQSYTSNAKNLSFSVETQIYSMPQLSAHASNGKDNSYTLGITKDIEFGEITAGGAFIDGGVDNNGIDVFFYPTLVDLNYGLTTIPAGDNAYKYGTGVNPNGWATDNLIQLYEPQSPLYFEGVNYYFSPTNAVVPANTEFTLTVIKCNVSDRGFPLIYEGDTIASSTLLGSEINIQSGIMKFTVFKAIDEDGFETDINGVSVDHTFALVLSGYNRPGVSIGFVSERNLRPLGETYTYFTFKDPVTQENRINAWIANNTMYSALVNGMYSYITADQNRIETSPNGGEYTFSISPLWNNVYLLEETPEWITLTKQDFYTEQDWRSDVTATVQALPAGITGRSADLRIGTRGAETKVRIIQGDGGPAGISSAGTKSLCSADRQGDNFQLFYPASVTSVAVYNIAGQRVAEYKLNATGTYTLPAGNLAKGIYVLKFNGEKSASVKILK